MNILEFIDLIIRETQIQRGHNPVRINLSDYHFRDLITICNQIYGSSITISANGVHRALVLGNEIIQKTSLSIDDVEVEYTSTPNDDQIFNYAYWKNIPAGNARIGIYPGTLPPVFGSAKLSGLNANPIYNRTLTEIAPTTKCSLGHKWRRYDSGWSVYDYCEVCDEKRNT